MFNKSNWIKALCDLSNGMAAWRIWTALGWNDVVARYRRSTFGPLWLTLSMGVTIVAIGIYFSQLFHMPIDDYLPFLAVGLIVWNFTASLINEGCLTFVSQHSIIRGIALPYSVHTFRFVYRALIMFLHNALIYVFVIIYFRVAVNADTLLAIFGIAFLVLNGVWVSLLLGLLSARFRDIPQVVQNMMQVLFFITPVFWKPDAIPGREILFLANPLFHFIELIRQPLLGQAPTLLNWTVVLAVTLLGWTVTFLFFSGYRRRIAYWV